MRALAGAVVIGILLSGSPLAAQWHLGAELGTAQYHGASRDTSGSASGANLRPDRPITVALRIERAGRTVSFALRMSYGKPGIAGAAPGFTFTDWTTGHLVEVVPLVGVRLARVGPAGALWIEGGPAADLWYIAEEIHPRVAALAALQYEWPVASRFLGSIRLEGTAGSSVFDAAELPPELERRPTWRYGVMLGLRYRL
jgi:hypothetical protein